MIYRDNVYLEMSLHVQEERAIVYSDHRVFVVHMFYHRLIVVGKNDGAMCKHGTEAEFPTWQLHVRHATKSLWNLQIETKRSYLF
jgi:hypothetical protein